jgi:cyd operon protein YbgT
MWYFAWILGMPLACCLAILNAMWLELRSEDGTAPGSQSGLRVKNRVSASRGIPKTKHRVETVIVLQPIYVFRARSSVPRWLPEWSMC